MSFFAVLPVSTLTARGYRLVSAVSLSVVLFFISDFAAAIVSGSASAFVGSSRGIDSLIE